MIDSKIESAKKLLANGVPLRGIAKNPGVSVASVPLDFGLFAALTFVNQSGRDGASLRYLYPTESRFNTISILFKEKSGCFFLGYVTWITQCRH